MPLIDYQERVTLLQKALAKACGRDAAFLNIPGHSIACKIDPNYYLAAQPFFDTELARAAGMFPSAVIEALKKTGLVITRPPKREHILTVKIAYSGSTLAMPVSFVDAEFIDGALRQYGGSATGLQVVDLRIAEASREVVEELFEDKTPPASVAFMPA